MQFKAVENSIHLYFIVAGHQESETENLSLKSLLSFIFNFIFTDTV